MLVTRLVALIRRGNMIRPHNLHRTLVMTAAVDVPRFTFNNGVRVPSVGLGCWMGTPGGGARVHEMVKKALEVGYRHFDTADGYKNEEEVGRAIRESGVPRSEIFVTTKLANGEHDNVATAFDASLKALGVEYVDLYLMHWPQADVDGWSGKTRRPDEAPTIVDTWLAMEKLLDSGKVKALGVSNFGVPLLRKLAADPRVKTVPVTNQVELHPCLPLASLRAYAKENGIVITAYSPLGAPAAGKPSLLLDDEDVLRIAKVHDATPAQVVLSWGVQHGVVVIPKTANESRMRTNIALLKLSEEDMSTLDAVHAKPGKHRSLLDYHGEAGIWNWTYAEMGWEMSAGGVVST